MKLAERIFKRYFKDNKEYRDFKSKYRVRVCGEDCDGNAGSLVMVIDDNGYVNSFEGKPCMVNVIQYVTGNDFSIGWCAQDTSSIPGKVILMTHRPIECGPAVYRYHHSTQLAIVEYYVDGNLIGTQAAKYKDNNLYPIVD